VANHLNDVAKIQPALVIGTLRRWRAASLQEERELDWMARHALRTLIKRGDPPALEFLGFSPDPDVSVGPITVVPAGPVRIGDSLRFELEIEAQGEERLVVDYVIDFVMKDGSTRSKVFKLKSFEMTPGEVRLLTKSHRMPATATTFTLYPGLHRLTVQLNGIAVARTEFEVIS
jgi:PAS domain-containing protein